MEIKRNGSQLPHFGPAEYFSGAVRIDPLFSLTGPARAAGESVSFEPGARTGWHAHPLGQILIVTAGVGWVQCWGEPKQEIRPGDVVTIPPNTKHWHGATASMAMTHITIEEALGGRTVDRLELVRDDQYLA